jgi:hypothetical protein
MVLKYIILNVIIAKILDIVILNEIWNNRLVLPYVEL